MKWAVGAAVAFLVAACVRDGNVPSAAGGKAASANGHPKVAAQENAAASAPIVVATLAEARAAIGRLVRVTGTAQREKLGDSVDTPGLTVICVGHRFPDERIGKMVAVEGVLVETSEFEATVNAKGEVSQGTEPGVSLYVIRACIQR